jgi:hypothetical protein
MIRYSLICQEEHEFDGWFGSSSEFDGQQKRGFVECPVCGSAQITKSLMAPNVSTSRRKEAARQPQPQSPQAEQPTDYVQAAPLTSEQRAALGKLREMKQKILANADDVGEKFPEEARKIHYGEAEARGIYGKANLQEAAELAEEGIDFLPLPDLPEEKN